MIDNDDSELDSLGRKGPKSGIRVTRHTAFAVLKSHIDEAISLIQFEEIPDGYNNRIYELTVYTQMGVNKTFILKVCGRFWSKLKTLAEVNSLEVMRNLFPDFVVPQVFGWDCERTHCDVEYILMEKLPGQKLAEIWPLLTLHQKMLFFDSLADVVATYKCDKVTEIVKTLAIGSLCPSTDTELDSDGSKRNLFQVGKTVEGKGPWVSGLDMFESIVGEKWGIIEQEGSTFAVMAQFRPRVSALIDCIRSDPSWAPDKLEFFHGDLQAMNILVHAPTSEQIGPQIAAVLDWEWAGVSPADEEYFASFANIIGTDDESNTEADSRVLSDHFFAALERRGVGTPRTIPHFEQKKCMYEVREGLVPWSLTDHPAGPDFDAKLVRAVGRVDANLTLLGH